MRINEDAIALFCSGLKTIGAISYNKGKHQVTREMVLDFNHGLFTDTIIPDSSSYNTDMCDFQTVGRHLFTPNQMWLNRDLVNSVANIMAKYHG